MKTLLLGACRRCLGSRRNGLWPCFECCCQTCGKPCEYPPECRSCGADEDARAKRASDR